MNSYITKRPLIGLLAIASVLPALGLGYYFQLQQQPLLMKVFAVFAGTGILALAVVAFFFADHLGTPIRVEYDSEAFCIKYLKSGGSVVKEKKILLSSLKGHKLYRYNLYAARLIFYYKDGAKVSYLLATGSKIKGFTLETETLLENIRRKIRAYNGRNEQQHGITRYPSFMASNAGLISVIAFIGLIFISILVFTRNGKLIATTTIAAVFSVTNLLLYRSRERTEIKKD